jgi:hypothetical protein
MASHSELLIPPAAGQDERSAEMVRAWVANKALHCTLRIGVWKDPAAWGILLADLARHVANAHHEQDGRDVAESLARIRKAFDGELDAPTDTPFGEFA